MGRPPGPGGPMPAYLFIQAKIRDPDPYAKYVRAVRELAAGWESRSIV